MEYFLIYLLLINAAGFWLMLADKQKARKNKWRISEATLLSTAILGGSLGVFLGMYAARHKTRHLKFSIGVPLILALQVVVGILIFTH